MPVRPFSINRGVHFKKFKKFENLNKYQEEYPKKRTASEVYKDLLFSVSMPKDDGPHLKDIKKIRMEKRAKRFNTQPTTIYWQVLGSGTYGGPTSLYLYTDHRRYS